MYGPFVGTLNIRCRIIVGIQKGTIILTTTHMYHWLKSLKGDYMEHYMGIYRV